MTNRGLDLTSAQLAVWIGQYMRPASPSYNHGMVRLIEGPLDIVRFERAVRATVGETEALNVVFIPGGERVIQVRRTTPAPSLRVIDMCAKTDPLDAATQWCLRDMDTRADLARGPLFEHALFVLEADRHLWYQRFHHILLDGFGEHLVADRVAQRYSAEDRDAEPAGFGPLARVVNDERDYLASRQCRADQEFWLDRMAHRASSNVPVFSGRHAFPSGVLRRRSGNVDAEPLATLGRRAGGSRSHAALAAIAQLIGRVSGVDEVVLGVPVLPRPADPSLAQIPSMRINFVALPVPCHDGLDLEAITRAVVQEMRDNRPHRRYPIERLSRDLDLVRTGQRLYGPAVNIMPYARDVEFTDCHTTTHDLGRGAKLIEDVAINMFARSERRVELSVEANADAYSEIEVDQVFAKILESMKMPGKL
ncbi:condensation domain-containing protein [Streptomyces sp. NBC_00233]|uniref:condensation domain-containing protein n=1 Tax=Streptomyces sp. NBC_00233 TaxID=2975686 RepID=UPI0022571D59|nr:condensation domain-containing protein [Streptomyces sp. NBC_00233]MCX5233310.1 condensation domain-containing protein [Streptomyces sp. NBC_00233]